VALVWWIMIVCVPMAVFALLGPMNSPQYDRLIEVGLGVAFLGVGVADVWLGWRWCRGKYVDAKFLEDLNEWLSARLRWRKVRASRIPVRVEYEFTGWRTWQRLVWQERHRESLHTGLLAIACAVGVLLALYSLAQRDSITFAIIGLVVPLPVAMGVLGLRFDTAGQQLRFLANRGSSPLAIWLAKQVVWLPRAFWIPAVAWGVACLAEWLFVPFVPGSTVANRSYWYGLNHHVWVATGKLLSHWNAVLWFVLLSYAAGQLMAILLRQFVIAAAASLVLSGLLTGWLALMVHYDVPRWWSVGSLVVGMLLVTAWYSRHWLLERRTWAVFGRLSVALLVSPLLLMGTVAVYRWLEVPGSVLKSRWLFTLLYPREAERRGPLLKLTGELADDGPMAEVQRLTRPVSGEEEAASKHLATLTERFTTGPQCRDNGAAGVGPQGLAGGMLGSGSSSGGNSIVAAEQPADALLANREQLAQAAFWAANESRLKEILEIAQRERCGPLDQFGLGIGDVLMPQQRLLLEAAQLRMDEGRLDQSLEYCCASLRLATFWARSHYWFGGDRQQAETLRIIVEWANHKAAANESLLPAIRRVHEELVRFPSMREAVVAQHLRDVESLMQVHRDLIEFQNSPEVVLARHLPTEVARAQRVLDQQLFWHWHSYQTVGHLLQQPGANAPRIFAEFTKHDTGFANDERLRSTTPLAWMTHPTLDEKVMELIVNREVVVRETLLAMAMLEWKRVHNQMPDFLGSLAPYCVIEKQNEPDRVLPVMALNDPWTGELFEYSGFWFRHTETKYDAPINIIQSAGPTSSRYAAKSVPADHPHVIEHTGGPMGVLILSDKGRLSLVIPPKPKR